MPRNSSGTVAWPSAAARPVISGTVASSTAQNSLEDDIKSELEGSLSRDGKGGMRAPLRVPDGTNAAPTITFTSEPGTGVYRKGASNPALTVSGAERQEWTATGSKVVGTLEVTGATLTVGAAVLTPDGSGNIGVGSKKLTGVADPTAAQDAATKAYADSTTNGASGIVWGTNWADHSSGTQLYKGTNGLVVLNFYADSSGIIQSPVATLPVGYRPSGTVFAAATEPLGSASTFVLSVTSAGVIGLTPPPTAGHTYVASIAFKAAP